MEKSRPGMTSRNSSVQGGSSGGQIIQLVFPAGGSGSPNIERVEPPHVSDAQLASHIAPRFIQTEHFEMKIKEIRSDLKNIEESVGQDIKESVKLFNATKDDIVIIKANLEYVAQKSEIVEAKSDMRKEINEAFEKRRTSSIALVGVAAAIASILIGVLFKISESSN